jgi:hypothetical protein
MTRKPSRAQSSVERLIEQRRQYKDWLAKLDAEAAGAAPSHVADKVREDYAARLEAVTKELAQHEGSVRQALVEAGAHAEELMAERQARTDELAEARLRRQVGEFGEQRFEEVSARCKSAVAELTKEIASAERDIERLEEVLAMLEGKQAVGEPARPVAPPPAPPPAPRPVAPPPPPKPESPPPAPKPRPSQMNLDELEFLRSVTGADAPKAPAAAPAAPPPPAPPPTAPAPPSPPPAAAQPPEAPPPREKAPPPPAAAPAEKQVRPSANTREAEAQTKTLKCSECGTMNAQTEWYCEKCGAELSSF